LYDDPIMGRYTQKQLREKVENIVIKQHNIIASKALLLSGAICFKTTR